MAQPALLYHSNNCRIRVLYLLWLPDSQHICINIIVKSKLRGTLSRASSRSEDSSILHNVITPGSEGNLPRVIIGYNVQIRGLVGLKMLSKMQ